MTKYTIEIKNPSGVWVVFNENYKFNWMTLASWKLIELTSWFPHCSFRIGAVND